MKVFLLSLRRQPGESELAKWIRRAKVNDIVIPGMVGMLACVTVSLFAVALVLQVRWLS